MAKSIPLAYLITFTCYGTRLHGDESGSVDRDHNIAGTPYLPPNKARVMAEEKRMKQESYAMDRRRRVIVLEALREVCTRRGWRLLAAHVRSNHVHFVVSAQATPEKVVRDVKVQATRALDRTGLDGPARRRWTHHGSTRYLWKPEHVEAAIHYVVREQGMPMAVWTDPEGLG